MKKKILRMVSLVLSLALFCGIYMPVLTVRAWDGDASEQVVIGKSSQETTNEIAPFVDKRTTPGLQYHFDMETLADGKIINKADGTEFVVNGNASLDVGAEGEKALKLDGTTYVALGTGFQPKNEYTMMGWVKQEPNPTDGEAVFYRGNSGSAIDNLGFKIYKKSVYHAASFAPTDGAQNTAFLENNLSTSHANIIPAQSWKHVAITRNGSEVKIYVDGKEIYKQSNAPLGDFTETTTPFYIGIDCDKNGVPNSHAFKGMLDDLRLYDEEVSADEIADICGASIPMDYELTSVKNGEITLQLSKTPSMLPTVGDIEFVFKEGDTILTPQNIQYSYSESSKTATYTFTPFEDFDVIDVTVRYANIDKTAKFASDGYGLKYRFDMEDIDGEGKLTNKVTGEKFAITGKQTLVKGKQGNNALELDGTKENYVEIGTGFQPENAFTTMAWIKVPNPNATQAVFARGNSSHPDDTFALKTHGGSVYSEFSNGTGNKSWVSDSSGDQTPNNVAANKWQHIAVTRDGANVRIYVNGNMVYENTNQSAANFDTPNLPMYIGIDCDSRGNVWAEHPFKGALDDLRLYDFAVSPDTIQDIFQEESIDFNITSVSNGTIEIELAKTPPVAPVQEDFTLALKDGDKALQTTVSEFLYDSTEQTVSIKFTPVENMNSYVKTISVFVEYLDVTREAEFILGAGTNEAPQATNLTVANLSPKLGGDPAVKGMLEAKYTYADPESDVEGDTKFQWYIADTKDDEYTPILGIRTHTVILLDKYVGKYLKCEVKVADVHGNISTGVFSSPTSAPVVDTEGNPLTDWFYESEYGVAHHFLSNYFNLSGTYADDTEKWDRQNMTWDEFVGQFDAEAYAKQIDNMGAKYVLLTLGQNSGSYCAPNPVYDKYMYEAGFIEEGEQNPKTVSMENDLPMKIADALESYGIELMLYLPSNPPHSASWDETGTPNVYGYYSDYLITKEVFGYTPGADGVPSQHSRKVLSEMVAWWSEHYSDKISGWWFDGCYYGGVFEGQTDMTQEYNLSTLANAAKAGNPYNIVTFNQGLSTPHVLAKSNDYQDYTAGETQGFDYFPVDGRWSIGPRGVGQSDDCQNFLFGPLGNRQSWQNGWGCKGTSRTQEWVIDSAKKTIAKDYVAGFDIKVNIHGKIDPAQYTQMIGLKEALRGYDVTVTAGTGSGSYLENETVTVTAQVLVGMLFDGWYSDDVAFDNENQTTTTFLMPARNVRVEARFKANPAQVDKSALAVVVREAEEILKNKDVYVLSSLVGLEDELNRALAVASDTAASQAEVDLATNNLSVKIKAAQKLSTETFAITATAGAGGVVIGGGIFAKNASATVLATADTGYHFKQWVEGGAVVSTNISYNFVVSSDRSLTAVFEKNGSPGEPWTPIGPAIPKPTLPNIKQGGSSNSTGTSKADTNNLTTVGTTKWFEEKQIEALIEKATGNTVYSKSTGKSGISQDILMGMKGLRFTHDTYLKSAVQVRVSIANPTSATKDILLSGTVSGNSVDKIAGLFNKWFANKLVVVSLDQADSFGTEIDFAVRVDLDGVDTEKLVLYSYDKSKNIYRKISEPKNWIDKNGYLHFTTELAGDIIISEGEFVKNN